MTDSPVNLTTGIGETVLPDPPPGVTAAIAAALEAADRRAALTAVAADHPDSLEAWGHLSEVVDGAVESYAYARVGYHRGLDALRKAGWRGSGYVRWEHVSNRGFLRSLEGLRRAADEIGETAEAERCALFLRQCDPGWKGVSD